MVFWPLYESDPRSQIIPNNYLPYYIVRMISQNKYQYIGQKLSCLAGEVVSEVTYFSPLSNHQLQLTFTHSNTNISITCTLSQRNA